MTDVPGKAIVLRGDARNLPLPDESVDLIVTSPPYFALRSYTDGGEHYAGQIGSEATPAEFIAALVECTREMVRVLKPSGSIWVDLGDKYSGAGPQNAPGRLSSVGNAKHWGQVSPQRTGIPNKSLMLLPERYRIACVDELGLIARAVVVWSKPNGLPESVTDRVRRSHEDWVHLVKRPRYFSAVDEIREQYAPGTAKRYAAGYSATDYQTGKVRRDIGVDYSGTFGENPLGKLPGSVWEIASQSLTVPAELGVDHFAAFPMEWPRRIILGWSPSGICVECGEGRRPDVDRKRAVGMNVSGAIWSRAGRHSNITGRQHSERSEHTITGYACACPEPTAPARPAVVLDPFGGTGTTALVASVLGRIGISVDMSADYCRLAQWRTTDPKQIERAARPPKLPKSLTQQQSPLQQSAQQRSAVDTSLETGIASMPMTTGANTSNDVREIQDRQASARGRVIAAANTGDLASDIEAALMELAAVWREEADWWEGARRRGWNSTAKELRAAAARLAGFAVGLTTRPADPASAPLLVREAIEAPMATEADIATELAKLTSSVESNVDTGQTSDPVMDFLTGATDTYNPVSEQKAQEAIVQSQPVFASPTLNLVDNPFTSPKPAGARSASADVRRLAYGDLLMLAAGLRDSSPMLNVSHSFVTTYESCSLKTLLGRSSRHGMLGAERPSWSLIGGRAFHAVVGQIETDYQAKPDGGVPAAEPLAAGVLVLPVRGMWYQALEDEITKVTESVTGSAYADVTTWHASQGGKEGFDWWRVEGEQMVRRWLSSHDAEWRSRYVLANMAPAGQPPRPGVEVEYTWTAPGMTVPAHGFVDLVWFEVVDNAIASVVIDDLKTGRNAPTDDFQLREYGAALRGGSALATPIKARYFDARHGTYSPLIEVGTDADLDEIAYRYAQAMQGNALGLHAPNRTALCSACSVRDYCPAIR